MIMHLDITFSFFSVFLFLLPNFRAHFPSQCLHGTGLCPGAFVIQWEDSALPLHRVQVTSLVEELRFYMLHRVAKIIIVVIGLSSALLSRKPTGSGSKSALRTGF